MYRAVYGMHVSVAIFFNHELPRRTEHYVTRKITRSAARIKAGLQDKLVLGDMSALLDRGHAPNIWMPRGDLQLDKPDTFVIGTGEVHSVQDFVQEVFSRLNPHVGSKVEFECGPVPSSPK